MTVEAARTNLDVYSQSDTDEKIETAIAAFPNATEVVKGKAKIATTEIAKAGINDTDFINQFSERLAYLKRRAQSDFDLIYQDFNALNNQLFSQRISLD